MKANDQEISAPCDIDGYSNFHKNDKNDKIWTVEKIGYRGRFLFSFDTKTIYNFWTDYPEKLSPEEIEIFKKEFPDLAELKE